MRVRAWWARTTLNVGGRRFAIASLLCFRLAQAPRVIPREALLHAQRSALWRRAGTLRPVKLTLRTNDSLSSYSLGYCTARSAWVLDTK
jgi:hypothetical protein